MTDWGVSVDLEEILSKMQDIMEEREERIQRFKSWLEENGFDEHREGHRYVITRGYMPVRRASDPNQLLSELASLDDVENVEILQVDAASLGPSLT